MITKYKVKLENNTSKYIKNIESKEPDYMGFTKTNKGYIYVYGWIKNLSSDIDLYIEIVNQEWLANKFNANKFNKWLLG